MARPGDLTPRSSSTGCPHLLRRVKITGWPPSDHDLAAAHSVRPGDLPGRRQRPARPESCGLPASLTDRDLAIMDIERINAIGNGLADLSERTEALRGYL